MIRPRSRSQIWPQQQRIRAQRALHTHFQNFQGNITLEAKYLRNEAKMALEAFFIVRDKFIFTVYNLFDKIWFHPSLQTQTHPIMATAVMTEHPSASNHSQKIKQNSDCEPSTKKIKSREYVTVHSLLQAHPHLPSTVKLSQASDDKIMAELKTAQPPFAMQ